MYQLGFHTRPATVIDHRLATVQTMTYCFIVNVINGSLTAVATVKGIHRVRTVDYQLHVNQTLLTGKGLVDSMQDNCTCRHAKLNLNSFLVLFY